jgi:nitrogen regulatory protein P-II 1
MKRIDAIIRPERLEAVKEALAAAGCTGITVSEVKGHGVQRGVTQQWRGREYNVDLLPKVSIMLVVNDHEAIDMVESIASVARTDRMGDGKIFVTAVEQVYRIRTGETGTEAL